MLSLGWLSPTQGLDHAGETDHIVWEELMNLVFFSKPLLILTCISALMYSCSSSEQPHFVSNENDFLTLTQNGKDAGWRKIFNGEDLTGWEPQGDPAGYIVQDGLLVFPVAGSDAYIRTEEDFKDFELLLDFKIGRTANSGVFLRADREGGSPVFSGCEIQILDDFNYEADTGYKPKDWQHTGSLYASVAPKVQALKPIGEWNTFHITYVGAQLKVELNGQTLYDVDTLEVSVLHPDQPLFRDRAPSGFIGLQRHAPKEAKGDAFAWFRNIFVREIE